MPVLHRDPDDAVVDRCEGELHPGVFEEPPTLEHWDLVANGWNQASVVWASEAGVEERDGVVIVTPAGALSAPVAGRLADRLGALIADRSVIVDLNGVILVSAAPVVSLVSWVLSTGQEAGQCCVVCVRSTARALLGTWHIDRCVAVFGSVGDALQARRFAHEGYGTGWLVDPPGWDCSDLSVDRSPAIVEHFEIQRPTVSAEADGLAGLSTTLEN